MNPLLDSLAGGFDGDATRRELLDTVLRDGLPGARSESWKYTSLRALERRSFSPATAAPAAVDEALLAHVPSPRLVFVNGRHHRALSRIDGLPAGVELAVAGRETAYEDAPPADAVFARLNAALAQGGVQLRVAADVQVDAPIHLVFLGAPADGDLAWHLRHQVSLGEGASLRLIEHQLSAGPHRHLDNSVLSVDVAPRATLLHARVQHAADGATLFLRTDARLGQASDYRRVDLELGGALSRHELNVRLVGDGAALTANGVLLAAGRSHVDTRLGIEHLARDTRCELLWRGIGAGRGRAVFHGGITIHAGADGADARLSNKNLLLSATAEVDTQPVLVIHADEVQAAHGATVGQLDANALFYLRSRGLPLDEARQLLTVAFCREPLAGIGDEAVREALVAHIDQALESVGT